MMRFSVTLLFVALLPGACRRPSVSGPLPHDVYVWQRQWTPTVASSIREMRPTVGEFCVLWREMTFLAGDVRATAVAVDLSALASAVPRAGFVLRIPSAAGGLGTHAGRVETVAAEIRTLHRRAAEARIAVEEVQIDYDCPTRRLADYAAFLSALKRAVPGTRITPTILPTWLDSPAWPTLARAGDGFVLQLHSIDSPAPGQSRHPLCPPTAAREAVRRAARQRVPFRAALPTYSSAVIYAPDGKIKSVTSEGSLPVVPPNHRRVDFDSPPKEMAALVADWTARRPAELTGLIWYRLPVPGDRRNWPQATFSAVVDGRSLAARISWEFETLANGARQVVLQNAGNIEGLPPETIEIFRTASNLVAYDALPPYEANVRANTLVFTLSPGERRAVAPGARSVVGWIRETPPP